MALENPLETISESAAAGFPFTVARLPGLNPSPHGNITNGDVWLQQFYNFIENYWQIHVFDEDEMGQTG